MSEIFFNEDMFDDFMDDDFESIFDFVSTEEESEAVKLYENKDIEGLKNFIDKLEKKYSEEKIIFLKALYANLAGDVKEKELMIKSLECYESGELEYNAAIAVYLANFLKKYYKDKESLEKINSFIIDQINKRHNDFILIEMSKKIVFIVFDALNWLKNNLELNKKEIVMLNWFVLKFINIYYRFLVNNMTDKEKKVYFNNYLRIIWELRDYLKKENEKLFSPIFEGVVWSKINFFSKNDEEIIKNIMKLGLDKSLAEEIYMYVKENEENYEDWF